MKIAIIGKGHVGSAIAKGLGGKHEVKFGHRDPKETVAQAAKWGEVLFVAVPYHAVPEVAGEIGSAADGKTVVDVTNAIAANGELAVGFSTSAAEEFQKLLPKARVVKAFNTVFAANQGTGKVGKETLTLFVAGDDTKAKESVMRLGVDIGFEPIDVGTLKAARYLEPMAMLIISLAFGLGMGTCIGYRLSKCSKTFHSVTHVAACVQSHTLKTNPHENNTSKESRAAQISGTSDFSSDNLQIG